MSERSAFSLVCTPQTSSPALATIVEEVLENTLAGRTLIESQDGIAALVVQTGTAYGFRDHLRLGEALELAVKAIGSKNAMPVYPQLVMVLANGYIVLIWPAGAIPGRNHVRGEQPDASSA